MTLKCKEIESMLSVYLENEMSPAEAANIAQHLASCTHCLDLKDKLEEILIKLSDLQEEVPFFLKNRLFNIPEIAEKKKYNEIIYFPKWIAAAIGTVILLLNLVYFTNIFPPANRKMHSVIVSIETFVVQTGGWFEQIKESKDLLLFTFFNKKPGENKDIKTIPDLSFNKALNKGGKNG